RRGSAPGRTTARTIRYAGPRAKLLFGLCARGLHHAAPALVVGADVTRELVSARRRRGLAELLHAPDDPRRAHHAQDHGAQAVPVVCLKSSPTMCGPAEVEAKVSLPGFFFAYCASSRRFDAGTEGCATATKAISVVRATAAKSFSVSYPGSR